MEKVQQNNQTTLPQAKAASSFTFFFQPKLAVSQPGDVHEQEANAMADKVMRMPAGTQPYFKPAAVAGLPLLQRKCRHCEEEEKLHRKESSPQATEAGSDVSSYIGSLSSKGSPLTGNARRFFEPRFGYSFSDVKIHTDTEAAQSAQSVNALAYTAGNHIVFAKNQFSPDTDNGKKLLAHELTHVVQQDGEVQNISRQPAPAMPPPEVAPEPTVANGNVPDQVVESNVANDNVPDPMPSQRRIWIPGKNDDSFDARYQRGTLAINAERRADYWQHTVEISVDNKAGGPPDFMTEQNIYKNTQGGNPFQPGRVFHILSKIEFDFTQANDIDSVAKLVKKYGAWYINDSDAEGAVCTKVPDVTLDIGRFSAIERSLQVPYGYHYLPPWIDEVYRVRNFITEQAAARIKIIRERAKQLAIAKEIAIAEESTLKGNKRKIGPCSFTKVPHRGGNKHHDEYADHVAVIQGYRAVHDEINYKTPEGIEYSFDTYNPLTNTDVWEVKTYHEWLSDDRLPKGDYIKGGIEPRFLHLEEQRLRGLYVAARCSLRFRYAFDKCQTVLGIRKQWLTPPVEYIPFPGEQPENCTD